MTGPEPGGLNERISWFGGQGMPRLGLPILRRVALLRQCFADVWAYYAA